MSAPALVFFLLLALGGRGPAASPAELVARGLAAYRAGEYARALEAFQAGRAAGLRDGRLEAGIGNCLWRLQQPARALAAWERAALYLPRDPELQANRMLARKRLGLDEGSGVPFLASLVRLLGAFTLRELAALAAGASGALFGCLILYALSRKSAALWLAGLAGLLLLLWGGQALLRGLDDRLPALVVAEEAALRAEPRPELPALATLRAGVGLALLGREGAWALVQAPGHRGWLEASAIEQIGLD